MRATARLAMLCTSVTILAVLARGQAIGTAMPGSGGIHPGYARRAPVKVDTLPAGILVRSLTLDARTGKVIEGALGTASVKERANLASRSESANSAGASNVRPNHPTIDGVDSLATFAGAFVGQGGPYVNVDFPFIMVGNDPRLGGTTYYPVNIVQVSVQLLNANGGVFKTVPFAPFEMRTFESPNFERLHYRSGPDIQYADAVHRAEFYKVMKSDWHTVLSPQAVNKTTIQVPYSVKVQLNDGSIVNARSYFTDKAADGSTVVFMLDLLFNAIFDDEVVNEINVGNFTTDGINTAMLPNTYLFSLNVKNPNTRGDCCVAGYHTYFYGPGTFPEPRWVVQYASWISPGIFGGGFEDVTALSHETSEIFADPFVDNFTAPWQFPNQPANSNLCQGNLENGDPLETSSKPTTRIEVKEADGFHYVYHPQNIAMYQWFEMGANSSAVDGVFSFPDATALTTSAIPCPQ